MARKSKLKEFRVKISDTITYSREATIVVRARDEEHAEEIGQAAANSFVYPKELVVAYGASVAALAAPERGGLLEYAAE